MAKNSDTPQTRFPYTFSGLNYRNAKLLIETLFKDHVVTVKRNGDEMCYEAYIRSGADEELMKKIKMGFTSIKFIIVKVK